MAKNQDDPDAKNDDAIHNVYKGPMDALVAAALNIASEGGWPEATFVTCTQRANIKLSELFALVRSKADILKAIEQSLTQKVMEEVGDLDESMSVRERLFDLLMTRFEVMNEQRDAYLVLSLSARVGDASNPIPCNTASGLKFTANLAGVDTDGIFGSSRLLVIGQIYRQVLDVWRKDESDDLAATMKALDTQLARAENWAMQMQDLNVDKIFDAFRKVCDELRDRVNGKSADTTPNEGQEKA